MQIHVENPAQYVAQLPVERQAVFTEIRKTILSSIPSGFEECINYGMVGYVVPHSLYAPGYHCDPKLPLPFVSLASQKNFIALYHMGIYADQELHQWWVTEYTKHCKYKLDMGKSCIRFKKMDDIPLALIGELMTKMSVQDWVGLYEKTYRSGAK